MIMAEQFSKFNSEVYALSILQKAVDFLEVD